jgi:hypothetical protein
LSAEYRAACRWSSSTLIEPDDHAAPAPQLIPPNSVEDDGSARFGEVRAGRRRSDELDNSQKTGLPGDLLGHTGTRFHQDRCTVKSMGT